MTENPNFYYKKTKKFEEQDTSYFVDKELQMEVSFYEFLNSIKEGKSEKHASFKKIESYQATQLISKQNEIEKYLRDFIKEKIDFSKLASFPLSRVEKTFFSGSALTSIILNFLAGTLKN